MPSHARATSTSSSITTQTLFPPYPYGGGSSPRSHHHDDEEPKPSSLRATCRENNAARSRRRSSLSHMALLDIQIQQASSRSTPPPPIPHPQHHLNSRSSSVSSALTDTLLPTLSPSSHSHYEAYSPDRPYQPGQPKSLAGIAVRAFGLGAALATGLIATLAVLVLTASPLWRLPFFLATLATFHFLEFWTTAAYNTREADVSSFLLTANWPAYGLAHTAAAIECLVSNTLFSGSGASSGSGRSWVPFAPVPAVPGLLGALGLLVGLVLVAAGQAVRSAAMVQAGPSFNHIVQQTRGREHTLVTTGIYGRLRHPSYFGFFWWGLGTQLVMGNVVCLVAYAAVLWRFFSSRIRHEESFLVKFFGDEYVNYRKQVGTKIPFVP